MTSRYPLMGPVSKKTPIKSKKMKHDDLGFESLSLYGVKEGRTMAAA